MRKETIRQVIDAMPDDVDLDELLNRLYVLDQIEEGERSLTDEGGIPHEEVKKRFRL
jgi:hypothetical protein